MKFDEQKKYVKSVNRIDGSKFSKVRDITMMIDLLNDEQEKKNDKKYDNEINAISKYYAPLFLRELKGEVSKLII